MKYKYKNLEVERYFNSYSAFYRKEDGTRFMLASFAGRTKQEAIKVGKRQIDYLNEKED